MKLLNEYTETGETPITLTRAELKSARLSSLSLLETIKSEIKRDGFTLTLNSGLSVTTGNCSPFMVKVGRKWKPLEGVVICYPPSRVNIHDTEMRLSIPEADPVPEDEQGLTSEINTSDALVTLADTIYGFITVLARHPFGFAGDGPRDKKTGNIIRDRWEPFTPEENLDGEKWAEGPKNGSEWARNGRLSTDILVDHVGR